MMLLATIPDYGKKKEEDEYEDIATEEDFKKFFNFN